MTKFRIDELLLESNQIGKKITQKQLAQAANVYPSAINKIVRNETTAPDPAILLSIADVLSEALGRKITLDDLIERDGGQTLARKRNSLAKSELMSLKEAVQIYDEDFIKIPVLGDVPCGDLTQVGDEHIDGYEWLHKSLMGRGKFFLRAKGLSMAPMIMDKDLLLIEPGNSWGNGSIVAAYVQGEVTCKKLYIQDGHAILAPVNPNYSPIIVTHEITIIGKVIRVIKDLANGWQP